MVRHAWERDLYISSTHRSLCYCATMCGLGHRNRPEQIRAHEWENKGNQMNKCKQARLCCRFITRLDRNAASNAARIVKHHTICNFKRELNKTFFNANKNGYTIHTRQTMHTHRGVVFVSHNVRVSATMAKNLSSRIRYERASERNGARSTTKNGTKLKTKKK